ncbi:MAG: hypothetical protein HY297_05785 [Thaumarchaeota archaeon]|nr:hypothetical protein [Nitrososphaerota archaeon]
MSKGESRDTYFNDDVKHRLVEKFTVAYNNKLITLNTSEKNEFEGEIVHDLTETQFKTKGWKDSQIYSVSYLSKTYTNDPTHRVQLVDRRFVDLRELVDKYSDIIETPESEKPTIEKRIYSMILQLKREGRIRGNFEMEPQKDIEAIRLGAEVRQVTIELNQMKLLVENLSKKVDTTNKFLKELLEKWQTKGIRP